MNKNQKLLVFLIIIVISVFVFTFMMPKNKEDFQSNFNFNEIYVKGDVGEQGIQGPPGPRGPKGADGPACKNIIEYLEKRGHLSLGDTNSSDTIQVDTQLELKGNIVNNSSNFSKLKITDYNDCYPILVGNNEADADFYIKKNKTSCKMYLRGDLELGGKLSFRNINNNQQSIDGSEIFYSLAPVGLIANYYTNRSSSLPLNWALCDGSTVEGFQTPDLRGKFVKGATGMSQNGTTNDSEFNETSRFKNGDIILQEANLPTHTHTPETQSAHRHTATIAPATGHTHSSPTINGSSAALQDGATPDGSVVLAGSSSASSSGSISVQNNGAHSHNIDIQNAGSHTHTVNSAGSGTAFNILPPYMTLVYIIKYK